MAASYSQMWSSRWGNSANYCTTVPLATVLQKGVIIIIIILILHTLSPHTHTY